MSAGSTSNRGNGAGGRNYLLLGPETGEKGEFVSSLKESLKKEFKAEPEEHTFFCFETEITDVVSLLRNGSLFTPFIWVVCKNAEQIKKKADLELLKGYLGNPMKGSILILESDEIRVDKTLEKVFPSGQKKIFWEMFENRKKGWVIQYFRKQGCSIEEESAERLLELVDNTTEELKRECDKLVLFFGEGSTISEEDVENYLYHSREETVFSLFDRIVSKDLPLTLETAKKMLYSGESNPIQLLAGLLWQFRNLLGLQELLAQRYDFAEACGRLRIRSKRNQGIYDRGRRNYSLEECRKAVSLIAEFDFRLRESRAELQETLMLTFLYLLLTKKKELTPGLFEDTLF
jgi:DNA polymerase III subunit delta